MFEYDICVCGNADLCPRKNECKRAVKPIGIYTAALFYEEGKECEYFWKKREELKNYVK